MKHKNLLFISLFWLVISLSTPSHALLLNPNINIDPWKVCEKMSFFTERKKKIPTGLLSAISKTETGRYNNIEKKILSWPWTINANGKGYYLETKEAAIHKVKTLQEEGIKSIDVGCMQINLLWHPNAFSSLEEAFDPLKNITYGSKFLSQLKKQHGNWKKAVGRYHSSKKKNLKSYQNKVLAHWDDIKDEVKKIGYKIPASEKRVLNFFQNTASRSLFDLEELRKNKLNMANNGFNVKNKRTVFHSLESKKDKTRPQIKVVNANDPNYKSRRFFSISR